MNKNVMTPTDNTTLHPGWCHPSQCGIEVEEDGAACGAHRSAPHRFTLRPGGAVVVQVEAPDATFHVAYSGRAAWHHRVVLHLPDSRLDLNSGEVAALTRLVTRLDLEADVLGAPQAREVTR